MKITCVLQIPYRDLPEDFSERFESVVTTPYHELVDNKKLYRDFQSSMEEFMHAARAGLDGLAITEHSQSSYDMVPNPDLVMSALAYATELEGIETAIYPLGRSLGKSREPLRVAEEYAMLDVMSGGRVVAGFPIGLAYDANVNNGVPPIETRPRFDENLDLITRAWTEKGAFAWNGKFSQYPSVNIWPRPLQSSGPPIAITGIGNPKTMEFCLQRGYGFNYFGWFGLRLTGKRIFDRLWETADRLGYDRNPYRIGFLQPICVAETDAKAEELYARHAENFFRRGLGCISMNRLALPGGIDIRGLEFIYRDPGDFGMYERMKNITFAELVDSGSVICGSPNTVAEMIAEFTKDLGIGNLHAMLQFGSMPPELTKHNIDLFAAEVAPRLRRVWAKEDWKHHWWPERLGGTPLVQSASVTSEEYSK